MAVDTFETPLAASDRWREFVARHPWGSAAIAGLVGTQMATLVGYYFIGVGLPQLPWPLYNGVLVIFNKDFSEFASSSTYFAGQSIHMVDGVVFTILYAATLYGRLPGPDSVSGDLVKGLTFSVILGLISMGFLVPYVYAAEDRARLLQLLRPEHLEAAAGDSRVAPCLRRVPGPALQPGAQPECRTRGRSDHQCSDRG